MNRLAGKKSRGIGMVEILVTVFVLAIGLLGVASLQFVGSFTNAEALSRTQAEFSAQQVAERLRASSVMDFAADGMVLDDGYFSPANYNFEGQDCASGDKYACFCEAIPASVPNCEGAQCTQAQMAIYDAWAASCSAVQTNPLTRVTVTCADNPNVVDGLACSPGSFIQIQLKWPLRSQQQEGTGSDNRCVQETGQAYGCVTKVMTL